jgi:hypothetical protein
LRPTLNRPLLSKPDYGFEKAMSFVVSLALCFFSIVLPSLRAQTIELTPVRVLVDEAAPRVSGYRPNERITIRSELVDGADGGWVSQSEFIADVQGIIDTSKEASVAGSYRRGLRCGARLVNETRAAQVFLLGMEVHSKEGRYIPPRNSGIQKMDFQLMRGATRAGCEAERLDCEGTDAAQGTARLYVRQAASDGLMRNTDEVSTPKVKARFIEPMLPGCVTLGLVFRAALLMQPDTASARPCVK